MFPYTENDTHMQTYEAESRSAQADRAFDIFVAKAEKLLGLKPGNLDGNEATDGYSIDGAVDAFQEGLTVEEYVEAVKAKQETLPDSLLASYGPGDEIPGSRPYSAKYWR